MERIVVVFFIAYYIQISTYLFGFLISTKKWFNGYKSEILVFNVGPVPLHMALG